MNLSEYDRSVVGGEQGEAAQTAMAILLRMQDVYGVDELMDISAAHIDSTVFMGRATLDFAERLAEKGARVAVPSTLNVSGVDVHGWKRWHVPSEHAELAYRQMKAYESMGCIPTWTCAPYQTEYRPEFGQQVAAGESNAIAYFNSVIGARTERYPDLLDICCAITGRVPRAGLHLDENRLGQILIQIDDDVPVALQKSEAFYPVLGHAIGKISGNRIPVVNGLEVMPSEDELKAVCAAAATSGAVALFHVVGVTPEAPTLTDAFGDSAPETTVRLNMAALRTAYSELTTLSTGDRIDMILLGSPHFSVNEFGQLAKLVEGRRRDAGTKVIVTCSRAVRDIIRASGVLETITQFGVDITVDTCPLTSPMLAPGDKSIMTNSAKYALYSPGLLNARVGFGSLADSVESAVAGKFVRDDSLWYNS